MPFPIPFLPMMVIAILIAAIFPTILKVCSRNEKVGDRRTPSLPAQTNLSSVHPFSDLPDVSTLESRPDQVRVTTKFVEISSGTEELSFDWIVPFEQ